MIGLLGGPHAAGLVVNMTLHSELPVRMLLPNLMLLNGRPSWASSSPVSFEWLALKWPGVPLVVLTHVGAPASAKRRRPRPPPLLHQHENSPYRSTWRRHVGQNDFLSFFAVAVTYISTTSTRPLTLASSTPPAAPTLPPFWARRITKRAPFYFSLHICIALLRLFWYHSCLSCTFIPEAELWKPLPKIYSSNFELNMYIRCSRAH